MTVHERELTCINCPLGCQLEVVLDGDGVLSVSGNSCPRGDAYARTELTDPKRTVTTTVQLNGSSGFRMLPVKTADPVPKDLVRPVVSVLASVQVKPPVAIGDVVLMDVCGTGVNVVATRAIK